MTIRLLSLIVIIMGFSSCSRTVAIRYRALEIVSSRDKVIHFQLRPDSRKCNSAQLYEVTTLRGVSGKAVIHRKIAKWDKYWDGLLLKIWLDIPFTAVSSIYQSVTSMSVDPLRYNIVGDLVSRVFGGSGRDRGNYPDINDETAIGPTYVKRIRDWTSWFNPSHAHHSIYFGTLSDVVTNEMIEIQEHQWAVPVADAVVSIRSRGQAVGELQRIDSTRFRVDAPTLPYEIVLEVVRDNRHYRSGTLRLEHGILSSRGQEPFIGIELLEMP